jgi:drug/metabolite transporter (DMT)-like permease
LVGVSPLVVATGSQLAATVMLAPFAWWHWPAHPVGWQDWGAGVSLAIVCTALAYLMYFRLIAHVGPGRAVSVTFLIPLFALVWGGLVLGEALTTHMVVGGGVVLLGTSLAVGLWQPRWLLAGKTPVPR